MNDKTQCSACASGANFPIAITMAFQPIVDTGAGRVFAHEALVRGESGESAGVVLSSLNDDNRYAFDQLCRVKAIDLAAGLGLANTGALLSINFLPNAVYEPSACIRQTLAAAKRATFPIENIIFEFTEAERLDTGHLLNILNAYRAMGFKTAIDDFGAGFAGLGLLAEFQPDIVKLDMDLIRGIDKDGQRRKIVSHTLAMLRDLGVTPVCEGVETVEEYRVLADLGVTLMQGYFFSKPSLAALSTPDVPRLRMN
ncbi:EAL domain-containing protein (putative c-di-GMP-specific phosphodiesterase class I) [Rhizobium sp. SG_E_25_P2]|uniref:EAL domain-containing protein n=1 Tax=Rhizobium sp. SG_E_25_P2 TaxID=2879942 RepID=UPI0024730170|nr:EAL domain-containing protein [Rhizobium sp. SG_E_25_P2]MDH6266665.1 EAL domain-containing protein (putative c-di-GMP-specific phosphodiesterase class I) [Rhizobium sp. SG_E_25_P2]